LRLCAWSTWGRIDLFKLPEFLQRDASKIKLKTLVSRLNSVGTIDAFKKSNYIQMQVPKLLFDEYGLTKDEVMNLQVFDVEAKINAISSKKQHDLAKMNTLVTQLEGIIQANKAKSDDDLWDGVLINRVVANGE
jgi:hypothetical protein